MKQGFIVLIMMFATLALQAQSIEGKWKTIDDATGKAKSIVEVSIKQGKMYGKIIQIINDDPNYDPICTKCTDHLNGKKILGMQIINGLTQNDGKWSKDKGILDPDNGKYYDCKIWVDEKNKDVLNVRGYISILYRTQTWHRVK